MKFRKRRTGKEARRTSSHRVGTGLQPLEQRQLMAADLGAVDLIGPVAASIYDSAPAQESAPIQTQQLQLVPTVQNENGYLVIRATDETGVRNFAEVRERIGELGTVYTDVILKKFNSAGELVFSQTRTFFEWDAPQGIQFLGGRGNDYFANYTARYVYARGGEGNDTLFGGSANDHIYGDGGNDLIDGGGGADYLHGGGGHDRIYGGIGNDTMYGGTGNDTMYGGSGNDYMYGEAGNDVMYGEHGNDYLDGGNDQDLMYGDSPGLANSGGGNDTLWGGSGHDTLYGGSGHDVLYGANGNDIIYAEVGNDTIYGGHGDDILFGGDGHDLIYGDDGSDVLYGDDGNDTLYGGGGVDHLFGSAGDDYLDGGNDGLADYLWGGSGRDTFIRHQLWYGPIYRENLMDYDSNSGDKLKTINHWW